MFASSASGNPRIIHDFWCRVFRSCHGWRRLVDLNADRRIHDLLDLRIRAAPCDSGWSVHNWVARHCPERIVGFLRVHRIPLDRGGIRDSAVNEKTLPRGIRCAITIDFRLDSRRSASGARYGRELLLAAFLSCCTSGKSWEGDE